MVRVVNRGILSRIQASRGSVLAILPSLVSIFALGPATRTMLEYGPSILLSHSCGHWDVCGPALTWGRLMFERLQSFERCILGFFQRRAPRCRRPSRTTAPRSVHAPGVFPLHSRANGTTVGFPVGTYPLGLVKACRRAELVVVLFQGAQNCVPTHGCICVDITCGLQLAFQCATCYDSVR